MLFILTLVFQIVTYKKEFLYTFLKVEYNDGQKDKVNKKELERIHIG